MLTRTQIQRLAQRNHIGMQAQERDYLQHLLLMLLYARSQALIFKGGTALRLVYRGARYSEDLDFSAMISGAPVAAAVQIADGMYAALRGLWQAVVADLRAFGAEGEIRNVWEGEVGFSFDVSYQGPLYDGRDRSKGKVRVDVSLRVEPAAIRRELVRAEYDDVRPFVVTVLSPEHLLAEKVRALLVRAKPRDLYDVWLMVEQGAVLDADLIRQKLRLYEMALTPAVVDVALARARADWERDLRPLLGQYVEADVTDRAAATLFRLAASASEGDGPAGGQGG
ncbi:MAG: nucleotidyl transferase AbiEii/AbiGii toxin family protein [Caldilineales bacterium]|nr:nucleotidyl transferase AbiEii/AbiGii toxin family protein [Caldilineales bacterium]